jgi:hypothetical protein
MQLVGRALSDGRPTRPFFEGVKVMRGVGEGIAEECFGRDCSVFLFGGEGPLLGSGAVDDVREIGCCGA